MSGQDDEDVACIPEPKPPNALAVSPVKYLGLSFTKDPPMLLSPFASANTPPTFAAAEFDVHGTAGGWKSDPEPPLTAISLEFPLQLAVPGGLDPAAPNRDPLPTDPGPAATPKSDPTPIAPVVSVTTELAPPPPNPRPT